MTTKELRAKFEAWANLEKYDLERSNAGWDYGDAATECAWRSWQAAHASRDAEVETLRKDAARYRWLRSRVAGTDRKPFICIFHGNFSLWNGEHADCEIDTAMREESK